MASFFSNTPLGHCPSHQLSLTSSLPCGAGKEADGLTSEDMFAIRGQVEEEVKFYRQELGADEDLEFYRKVCLPFPLPNQLTNPN